MTHHGPKEALPKLMLGAIACRSRRYRHVAALHNEGELSRPHPLAVDRLHIFGVLSLIFWTLMMIVTFKYVSVAMRADNRGEGGSFALLSLIARNLEGKKTWAPTLVMLGVLATCLFYGDAMITPAISVLSAVEGLTIVQAGLQPLVVPIAIGILGALFLVQTRGTAKVGNMFGPVMLVYFAAIAVLGVPHILQHPEIMGIINPIWAVKFFSYNPKLAFLALGSVFLCVTGAEALYADMGHFGRKAINFSWLTLVYPCLALNYMGQGALLLSDPHAAINPFFLLAPEPVRCVFSCHGGDDHRQQAHLRAFSVTHRAIQLGFLPRLRTNTPARGARPNLYPAVNWGLVAMVIPSRLHQISKLASPTGSVAAMLITSVMLGVLMLVWSGIACSPTGLSSFCGRRLFVSPDPRRLVPAGGCRDRLSV